jgi:hypothetical protein
VDDTVPLVKEREQRFKLEDRDTVATVQMYHLIIVVEPLIVAAGLPSKYTSEYGGISKQEVFVYSKMSVPDLSNMG